MNRRMGWVVQGGQILESCIGGHDQHVGISIGAGVDARSDFDKCGRGMARDGSQGGNGQSPGIQAVDAGGEQKIPDLDIGL